MHITNYYDWLLSCYFQKDRLRNVVQIGANDGRINDPIYKWVMANKQSTMILLVEPQSEVIPFLQENYLEHPNFMVVNEAVGGKKNLTLYRLKPELWSVFTKRYLQSAPSYRVPTGFASQIKSHVLDHIRNNLPPSVDEEGAIETLNLPSSDLSEMLVRYDFPQKIDLLQVDCEGMDDEVLYCCNLFQTSPEIINFEFCHIPPERFNKLVEYLNGSGYMVYRWSKDDAIAIKGESIFNENLSPYPLLKM
jgi:FkbM family methyltransferase